MAKTGRPRKEINWNLLESLGRLDASLNYCAESQLNEWKEEVNYNSIVTTRDIIERRIRERHECTFLEFKKQKIEPVALKLRQKQVDIALNGNVTMLIWLGKQMLGQREKIDQTNFNGDDQLTDDQLRDKIEAMLNKKK